MKEKNANKDYAQSLEAAADSKSPVSSTDNNEAHIQSHSSAQQVSDKQATNQPPSLSATCTLN